MTWDGRYVPSRLPYGKPIILFGECIMCAANMCEACRYCVSLERGVYQSTPPCTFRLIIPTVKQSFAWPIRLACTTAPKSTVPISQFPPLRERSPPTAQPSPARSHNAPPSGGSHGGSVPDAEGPVAVVGAGMQRIGSRGSAPPKPTAGSGTPGSGSVPGEGQRDPMDALRGPWLQRRGGTRVTVQW